MPRRKTTTKSPKKTAKRTAKKTTVRSPKRTAKKTTKGATTKSPKRTTKGATIKSPKRTTTKSPKRTTIRSLKRTTKRTKRGLTARYESESIKNLYGMAMMSDDTTIGGQLQNVNEEVRNRLEKLANRKNTANLKLLLPAIRDREFQKADKLFESLLDQTDDDATKKEINDYKGIVEVLSKKQYLYKKF